MPPRPPESPSPDRSPLRVTIEYGAALAAQEALVARRLAGNLGDVLWILEHPPTITFGTSGGAAHLRASEVELAASGVSVVATRRGGDVTCHEPGQIVGYPIVSLASRDSDRDLHRYMRRLEEALIAVLSTLGLAAGRVASRTGVWLHAPDRKIAAIGVRVRRWVTSHGFALNFENDLATFRRIVPCGIADASVTSIRAELPPAQRPPFEWLVERLHIELERVLERDLAILIGEEGLLLAGPDPG